MFGKDRVEEATWELAVSATQDEEPPEQDSVQSTEGAQVLRTEYKCSDVCPLSYDG